MICGDSGPLFAADYGWNCAQLGDEALKQVDFVIIDNRFQPTEIGALSNFMSTTKAVCLLRIGDPFESLLGDKWYQFVNAHLNKNRVHIMVPYLPVSVTANLYGRARSSQFVHAPYVYDAAHEVPIEHAVRSKSILLTGAINRTIYPKRSAFYRSTQWCIPLAMLTQHLPHPGYSEVTTTPRLHEFVGNAYIQKLAEHRFAFACSSVARIELLKYREIAYAGSVPVGDLPTALMDFPRDAFVPWRRNPFALASDVRAACLKSEEMAQTFRLLMRQRRDVSEMRAWVTSQICRLG